MRDHGHTVDEARGCEGMTKRLEYFKVGGERIGLAHANCKNRALVGESYCWIHLPVERKTELNKLRGFEGET